MPEHTAPVIGLTLGEITGIGPELVAKVLSAAPEAGYRILVVDDADVIRAGYESLSIPFDLAVFDRAEDALERRHAAAVLDLAHADKSLLSLGRPHPEAGKMAARAMSEALRLGMAGTLDGVVYAPLCKETLDVGGGRHGDELELFQSVTEAPEMARVAKIGEVLRTTVTGHVPFKDIASAITKEGIVRAVEVLAEASAAYGIDEPHIAVSALNPHAGESGLMGREEIDVIEPAVQAARLLGIDASGPYPADTIYVRAFTGEFDGVVNLYHDQGNIAAKVAGFGEGILVYVRSPVLIGSVSHGVAYDIAGQGVADPSNLRQAIEEVALLATRSSKQQ